MLDLSAALLAGLAGSPHCVGMCGGFCASAGARPFGQWAWHAGRLTTYATLGAVAALAGRLIPGPPWFPQAFSLVLLLWFALALAGVVREPRIAIPGVGKVGARLALGTSLVSRYAFGLATGLLPCGLVYAALAIPVSLGDPLRGALVMVAFGAGTIPALATLSAAVRRVMRSGIWPRRILAALVFAAGLWALSMRMPGSHLH